MKPRNATGGARVTTGRMMMGRVRLEIKREGGEDKILD
jgi:hypothetical protein